MTWPYAYYVTLGSSCKMANSSSEDKTDICPRDPQGYSRISLSLSGRILKEYWKQRDSERVLEAKPHAVFHVVVFAKSHSLKCSIHKWVWCGAARKSARVNCINLIHFCLTAGRLRGSSCIVIPGVVWHHFQGSIQKIKSIKNPIKQFWLFSFH